MRTVYETATLGFACPNQLEEWLRKEAKARGISKSRLVVTILLDASGLDIDLPAVGRPRERR